MPDNAIRRRLFGSAPDAPDATSRTGSPIRPQQDVSENISPIGYPALGESDTSYPRLLSADVMERNVLFAFQNQQNNSETTALYDDVYAIRSQILLAMAENHPHQNHLSRDIEIMERGKSSLIMRMLEARGEEQENMPPLEDVERVERQRHAIHNRINEDVRQFQNASGNPQDTAEMRWLDLQGMRPREGSGESDRTAGLSD